MTSLKPLTIKIKKIKDCISSENEEKVIKEVINILNNRISCY